MALGGILKLITGVGIIAGALAVDFITFGGAVALNVLIPVLSTGAGLALSGAASLAQGDPIKGFATATRNPIASWRALLGCTRTPGNLLMGIYPGSSGEEATDVL